MRITAIETHRYRMPLDPPFVAAWDPIPRDHVEDTIVVVCSDEGVNGYASGHALPDRGILARHLIGLDPLRTEVVREICQTVDFHGGRPWTVEVAVWDLVGKSLGVPLWRLLGGRSEHLVAYASAGESVDPEERAKRAVLMRNQGIRALKVRLRGLDWRAGVETVAAVRDAVGPSMKIMVDANHGWRTQGDRTRPWDVATATQCARALEPLDVYWLEEPLPTSDVEGYHLLRQRTGLRIAAGEMVRGLHEARDLLLRGGVDVIQTDAVLAGGIGGCRRIAAMAELCDRTWSPHTWSNGYGLLCNLHLALALSTVPYIEVPHDPPGWSPERRDWLLPDAIRIDSDGRILPPNAPGLGMEPDFEALELYKVGEER